MAHPDGLSQWTATVAKELTPLSPAQARVLALWSYGMVLTQSCACHTIAVFLGLCSGEGYHALRQRLREWCYDASDKRGLNRQAVDVTVCFAPLLAWVMPGLCSRRAHGVFGKGRRLCWLGALTPHASEQLFAGGRRVEPNEIAINNWREQTRQFALAHADQQERVA